MFLIKSKLESGKYGVLDTSDGVEEFYTAEEIFNIVKSTGIQIQGVSISENNMKIVVYDPRSKLKLLYGSQISFSGNDIIFNKYSGSDAVVEIPYGVNKICDSCFSGCANLRKVIIPNSVKSLGDFCFSYCEGLKEISIPDSVMSLGGFCFKSCHNLKEITISNSVTSLGDFCFWYCESLRKIKIPRHTVVGKGCFDDCPSDLEIVRY